MNDNPYRFTVQAEKEFDGWFVYVDWFIGGEFKDSGCIPNVSLDSEAEANEHAELIRQAMREVSSTPVCAEETLPNAQVQP